MIMKNVEINTLYLPQSLRQNLDKLRIIDLKNNSKLNIFFSKGLTILGKYFLLFTRLTIIFVIRVGNFGSRILGISQNQKHNKYNHVTYAF